MEQILIKIRDWRKKKKIMLVKAILIYTNNFNIKDKLEIIKFLIEE